MFGVSVGHFSVSVWALQAGPAWDWVTFGDYLERVGNGSVQLRHVVEKLQRKLGAKVALRDRGGAGTLELRYHSHAELDRILQAILGDV